MKYQILLILIASSNIVISQSINRVVSESSLRDSVQQFSSLTNILFPDALQNGPISNNLNNPLALLNTLGQFQIFMDNLQNLNLTENECTSQLKMLVDGLLQMDEWAVQMIDATAKLQPGILEGNIMQLGHYDECLKIDVSVNGSQINGQYCTVATAENTEEVDEYFDQDDVNKLLFSYGFCVPAACNASYLRTVLSSVLNLLQSPNQAVIFDNFCLSAVKPNHFSAMTVVTIVFFAIMGIIIVLSTLYDILISYNEGKKPIGILTVFSFYTNGQKLFCAKKIPGSLGCLNGMRVISMLWIVVSHRYMYMLSTPMYNALEVLQWYDDMKSVLVTAGNMSVDTFFVISGILVVYMFMKHSEQGRNMSVSMYYVHRILRLTPSLAVLTLFTATCISYIGSGPLWPAAVAYLQKPCETKWWTTILYVQNYIGGDRCIGHAWYLAVDTHLYFLSPLLLFPLIKWPKRTIFTTFIITLLCCFVAFEITWLRELRPAHYGFSDDENFYLYMPTHIRAAPWLVGFIAGYIIFNCRNRVIKITKIMVVVMWTSSLGLMIGIILCHYRNRATIQVDLLESALFNGLARFLWAIGISIIIFLCVTGYGGFVDKFLSCSIFTVLIRVNYSMYLLHIPIIIFFLVQARVPLYASHLLTFHSFSGDVGITLLVSIVWTLAFESPIMALEKIIFKEKKRSPLPTSPVIFNNDISVVVVENKLINSGKLQ